MNHFKLSFAALLVASISSTNTFAAETPPDCLPVPGEFVGKPGETLHFNPHCAINLTPEIENLYKGDGVKIGVVDSGFVLKHPSLDVPNITPLKFTLNNPIANREDSFDPAVDFIDKDNLFVHGSQITAILKGYKDTFPWLPEELAFILSGLGVNQNTIAKLQSFEYDGGTAKNADVYLATFNPTDKSGMAAAKYIPGAQTYVQQANGTTYILSQYAGALNRVLAEKPFAINISSNTDGDRAIATTEQADRKYQDIAKNFRNDDFIQAVHKTVENDTLLVFPTGNEAQKQPGAFSLLPRYFSGLNKHLISVTATDGNNQIASYANHCGGSKEWCIAAPGSFFVLQTRGTPENQDHGHGFGTGTSNAAPVVTGGLAVLKQRFNYFTPTQVRDTLFTTATDLGETGVDEVYGWGLVNLEHGVKGPTRLLNDETYQVTQNDTWSNPLNTQGNQFTKSGSAQLTLAGENQLNQVAVNQGTLDFSGRTRATAVTNNATLAINHQLTAPISATMNSQTTLGKNGHWIMPTSSTVGSVHMEEGAQITLNPSNSTASGNNQAQNYNTLTINQNLSGNGIFNYLTRLQDWVGDKVLVNGIASGNFKLNVQNSGAEPADPKRLTLLELRHGAQSEHAVNVELVNPVDFGAYRYELQKDNFTYRLYNPKKEKELADAAEAEKRRAEQEAQRQAQAQQQALAEAQQLAAQRQRDLDAEKLAKEAAQQELAAARSRLATQTQALQAAEQTAREKEALATQTQRQLSAAQTAERAARAAEQAARDALAKETEAKQAAITAQQAAERLKAAADNARDDALRDAQAALRAAEQKAEEARQATEKAATAQAQQQQAQTDLANATAQLTAQQAALAKATEAEQATKQALDRQTTALTAAQQAREQAEQALQAANREKATALEQAQAAQRIAEQKTTEAQAARELADQKTREADDARREVDTARQAQQQAEREKTAALDEARRLAAEKAALESAQNGSQSELIAAQRALNEAQAQLTAKAQEAEAARQAQQQAEQQAQAERLNAQRAKEEAERQKAEAESAAKAAQQQAATDLAKEQAARTEAERMAQTAQAAAETQARLAEEAKLLAQTTASQAAETTALALTEKTKAEQSTAQAIRDKATAEQTAIQAQLDKITAEQAAAQALAEKAAADQARRQAEQLAEQFNQAKQQAETAQSAALTALGEAQQALQAERQARQTAEAASAELAELAKDTAADLTAARQALQQAEANLTEAQQALIAKTAEAEKAQQAAHQATLTAEQLRVEKATAENQALQAVQKQQLAETAQAEAERLRDEAQAAQIEAENAKAVAEGEVSLAQAEQAAAETAQADAEQQRDDAQAAQNAAESAKADAEQQVAALREQLNAQQSQQAALTDQRKQAEIISRYSNSALSELSAQVNVLEQISHSLNAHLFDTNRSLSVSAAVNQQHGDYASDNYRRYQQDTTLKQVAVSVPVNTGNEQLHLGVVVSDARSGGQFDDNASYQGTTKMASAFARLNVEDRFFAELDAGVGRSRNQIRLDGETSEFSRDLKTLGVRAGYSADAFGLKVQPSIGLRYHHLGDLNYRLHQAEIRTGQLNIAGVQAGLRVEKTWQWGRAQLTPYFAGYYSDMSQQTHQVEVNDQALTQQFGRYYRHELGLNANYAQWYLNANAGTISGNEAAKQRYAGVKLNYQW